MGFRFQKRIKITPGISINLSKSGVSTSVGVTGARVTLGHGKTRTTLGLPGSGISHTSITSDTKGKQRNTLLEAEPAIENQPAVAQANASYLSVALAVVVKVLVAVSLVTVAVFGVLLAVTKTSSKRRR